jgi:dTMP kinase
MQKGKYIVFEGMDGSGKSTCIEEIGKWLKEIIKDREVISTKEPGCTPIGKKIRDIILYNTASDALTDVLLFMSDRNENKYRTLIPNLDKGNIILCDRNYYSSLVYQGYMNNNFDMVYELHKKCDLLFQPDILFLFDLDPELGMSRTGKGDKFEVMDKTYFEKVRNHYLKDIPNLIDDDCKIFIIDTSIEQEKVIEQVKEILFDYLTLENFLKS